MISPFARIAWALGHGNRHPLRVRFIGGKHQGQRMAIVDAVARRRLAALKRPKKGLDELAGCRSKHVRGLSCQRGERLSAIEASAPAHGEIESEKGLARCPP